MSESAFTVSTNARLLWFGWFLILGAALTWIPMGGFVQFGLVLGGFGIPLFYAWKNRENPDPPLLKNDVLSPLPAWAWLIFIALALGLRLVAIQTLPAWPNSDEGGIGTIGWRISQHWTSRFFYSFAQTPPLTFWLNALAVKAGLNPLLSLWLPPALISVLTLGVGYWAARRLFSSSQAFLFTALLAFSFWPLYMGRHCHEGVSVPIFEFLVLVSLTLVLQPSSMKGTSLKYFLFGFIVGLGYFTFTSWIAIVILGCFFAGWIIFIQRKSQAIWYWLFGLGLILGALPLIWALATEGYGNHLASLTPWSGWFPWAHQAQVDWHYLTVLFWGAFDNEAAYTPVEGGFLNPLLGAFFFLGLIQVLQHRKESWAGWVLISFPILLLPGLLSMNVEAFRIVQVLPLLLFIAAIGLQFFLEGLSTFRRWPYLLLLLLVSLGFDLYRLAGPWMNADSQPGNFDRPVKSVEKLRAYKILEKTYKEYGPGLILADFDTEAQNDSTLSLCSRTFSMDWGIDQTPIKKLWFALYINVHYQPFLEKRLPDAQWYWVGQGLHKADGGSVLVIVPILKTTSRFVEFWPGLNTLMRKVDEERLNQPKENWEELLNKMSMGTMWAKKDPLLASVYWDKVAAFEYGKLDYDAHLAALQHAVKAGYPTAALCFELGNLYLTKGFRSEAIKAYQQALKAPLDLTPSRLILDQLRPASVKP